MPVAERLARGRSGKDFAPILLDSHDLQARQFALMNERMPWLHPRATYDAMLARELDQMRKATLLLHLNAQEDAEFRALLPEKSHALLYPAVPEAPTGPGGPDIVLVASNNTANVESVIWFLREVAPRAAGLAVKIAGNVDAGVRSRAPSYLRRHKSWFLGRVADPGAVYANATARAAADDQRPRPVDQDGGGAGERPAADRHHSRVARDGAATRPRCRASSSPTSRRPSRAPCWRRRPGRSPTEAERRASAARAFYDAHFSLAAYERDLASLVAPLLARGAERH